MFRHILYPNAISLKTKTKNRNTEVTVKKKLNRIEDIAIHKNI